MEVLTLRGGEAKSPAFRELLQEANGADIIAPQPPQHHGAFGCAVLAGR